MLPVNPVNQTERLYKIEQMLSESGALPIKTMLERLEISRATFKRDLDGLIMFAVDTANQCVVLQGR